MVAVLGISSVRAEPPICPPGYSSEAEIRSAWLAGKLSPIDLAIPVPVGIQVEKGVEFGQGGDQTLRLDLYRPKRGPAPAPAVVFVHGGAWEGGQRESYHYHCVKFAEQGYVAVTISYRLSGAAPFPAQLEDVKCAVRWMRANAHRFGVDRQRIAIAGGSAGGHLALLVAYTADRPEFEGRGGHPDESSGVQAVIDLYGPTDLTAPSARNEPCVIRLVGGKSFDDAPELYIAASPIAYVTANDPPTLILHGSLDKIVQVDQAAQLAKRLTEAGARHEYDRLEGWPHTMDLEARVNRYCLARMFDFLKQHLK